MSIENADAADSDFRKSAALLIALTLLSAAVTAHQVALMQILGWMHWHHFAYMIVALALLGFGVAGTVLSLARDFLLTHANSSVQWLLILTAVTIPLGVGLAQTDTLAVDLPLVFFDPARNTWRLAALCLLLLPPFFCGGLATGLILTVHARRAGYFYAASLAGAGLGGLLGLMAVAQINPPRLPAAVAALALAAAVALLPETPHAPTAVSATTRNLKATGARPLYRIHALMVAAAALFITAAWLWPVSLQPSQFKPIRRVLELPNAHVVATRPSVHGWIQIVDAPALRPAPAVSLNFHGEIPSQRAVFINGLDYGSLLDAAATRDPSWLEATTDAVAFQSAQIRHVLLLENGPGGWAALAVRHGANRIAVVEPNHALVTLLSETNPPLAPEWRLPAVERIIASARTYLLQTDVAFDVIRFPSIGALGGTAGLASTSEQFLLTRQAFTDAWRRLAPGGVIAVTAWMDFPERNPLRLLATLVETVAAAGRPPRAHLIAVRGWATVTFLLRRDAWSASEVAEVRQFCVDRGFDPLLLPNLRADERESFHAWENPDFFRLVDRIVDGPREPVYRDYSFFVQPTTDDRPYFSQFVRWTGWDRMVRTYGARTMPFFELGSLTVALTLLILLLLAVSGIVLPLARHGWRTPGKAAVLLYFGGLGAGFMFVEIGLMLWAHAWLGSPVLAAAVVLTALLISSGAGSGWSERCTPHQRNRQAAIAAIVTAILVTAALLFAMAPVARVWPSVAKIAILLGLVAPLGAAMGMAFPLGLRSLEAIAPAHIPWAWAVNGCISVVAPAVAILLAMSAGFSALAAAAAVAYSLALLGASVRVPTRLR